MLLKEPIWYISKFYKKINLPVICNGMVAHFLLSYVEISSRILLDIGYKCTNLLQVQWEYYASLQFPSKWLWSMQ